MGNRKGTADKRFSPEHENWIQYRNRHLPEWRFLLFTIIVTVKGPICNVIRIGLTSFRRMWLNRLPYYRNTLPFPFRGKPIITPNPILSIPVGVPNAPRLKPSAGVSRPAGREIKCNRFFRRRVRRKKHLARSERRRNRLRRFRGAERSETPSPEMAEPFPANKKDRPP